MRLTHRSVSGRRISSFWAKRRMEFFFGGILDVREKTRKKSWKRSDDLMDLTCFSHDSTGLNQPRWNEQPPFGGEIIGLNQDFFSGYDSVWRMRWLCHHKWHRALYFSVVGELSCWNTSGFGGLTLRQTYWGLAILNCQTKIEMGFIRTMLYTLYTLYTIKT